MIMERYDTTSMAEAPRFLDADAERGFLSTCRGDDDNSYRVYAAGLEAGSVVADLHKRDFVGFFPVRRHEGGATGNEVIGMQAQDVLVPFLGKLCVAHVDVNVP